MFKTCKFGGEEGCCCNHSQIHKSCCFDFDDSTSLQWRWFSCSLQVCFSVWISNHGTADDCSTQHLSILALFGFQKPNYLKFVASMPYCHPSTITTTNHVTNITNIKLPVQVSHEKKKTALLSIESWLFHKGSLFRGLLASIPNTIL